NPAFLAEAGMVGEKLLSPGQGAPVIYSFTLYERSKDVNRLLVQVDTAREALNLNEGSKLELGSTAKLRTLATYLEVIAALHEQLSKGALDGIRKWKTPDKLTEWAMRFMAAKPSATLPEILEASMLRTYSGSPDAFFTGGGLHVFANFEKSDNGRILTVRE